MQTHPPSGRHDRIISLWHTAELTAAEIAREYGLATITVLAIWCRAKKAGKLPKYRRPDVGTRTRSVRTLVSDAALHRINVARTRSLGR